MIENFESNKFQILEIKEYVESITPQNSNFSIEFDGDIVTIFHLKNNGVYDDNWDPSLEKIDSLVSQLNWNNDELKVLKSKLNKANCISISTRKPLTIGFQRSGMGMYFYNLFDENLNDSLISRYSDGCNYIFYRENVVIEYGGGAFGPQCFSENELKN